MLTRRALFQLLAAVPLRVRSNLPAHRARQSRWSQWLRREFPAGLPLPSEIAAAKRFFAGDQWPAEVVAARRRQGRPCLTVNRLPAFVAADLLRSGFQLTEPETDLFVTAAVRRCKDSQRMYNWARSNQVEARGRRA